ncbi:MAG: phage baseplate protein [Candidatus Avelusimicrobium sp.]|uniref:phage baseplate protein n=1 Tax=Candidatus Avelusimicrobium sp. TaxID=3048833 RepID=UPI003EFCE4AA
MAIPTTADLRHAIGQVAGKDITGIRGWQLLDHKTSKQICSFTSFFGFEHAQKAKVVDYPVEADALNSGSFYTYNKQLEPFKDTVTLIKDGINLPGQKEKFLQDLEKYLHGLDTVDIITPDKTYINCLIEGNTYKKTAADGADLILVTLSIREIREVQTSTSTSYAVAPNNPSSADTKDLGFNAVQRLNLFVQDF